MELILISLGIFFIIVSLFVIFISRKNDKNIRENLEPGNLELEYRDLKNQIMELTKEFTRTANFNTNILDEKITYVNEMREDLDMKILRLTKMMTDIEIYCNRMEKVKKDLGDNYSNKVKQDNEKVIKMQPKRTKIIENPTDEIVDLLDSGYTYLQISKKTGKTLGEIEFILGLRKMR